MSDNVFLVVQAIDVNGDGTVSEEEVSKVLARLGIETVELRQQLTAIDSDGDGGIDVYEYA